MKEHWEHIFKTKNQDEVSWFQKEPKISLDLILEYFPNRTGNIIDVGGGDSNLIDFLLKEKYCNITVLDISKTALQKSQERLGAIKGEQVKWIETNILNYSPEQKFDLWHDRALFHFLTEEKDIEKYRDIVTKCVSNLLIVSTFSDIGPKKCSNLEIRKYSAESLSCVFNQNFDLVRSIQSDHLTPFNTKQNFIYCLFKRKSLS